MEDIDKLKQELQETVPLIDSKLKSFYMSRPLPYGRIAKGRLLRNLITLTLEYMEQRKVEDVKKCVLELKEKGLMLKNG